MFYYTFEKHCSKFSLFIQLVGSKEKGRISKRVFQENKAKFSDKRIFLTIWYRCEGVRNFRFPEKLACFAFLLPPFWDSPFCLIIDELSRCKLQKNNFFFILPLNAIGNTVLGFISIFIASSVLLLVILITLCKLCYKFLRF